MNEQDSEATLQPRLQTLDTFLPERGRLLDIGASRGHFLHEARKRGWTVDGIEAGEEAIAYAGRTFDMPIRHGTLETTPLESEGYDCIHLSHVLEHLFDPRSALEKIYDGLRPGGILVVEVPYEFGDLFAMAQRFLLGRLPSPNVVPSTHLYFFTMDSLCRLVRDRGFDILQTATPRRNHSFQSRVPGGVWAKRWVYHCEQAWKWGPHLEVYAQKPHRLTTRLKPGESRPSDD